MTDHRESDLVQVAIAAIRAAMKRISSLGEEGKKDVPVNPVTTIGKADDVHLLADAESEWAMVQVFHEFGRLNGLKFNLYGEEVGEMVVGDLAGDSVITAVFDGIDGTSVFKKNGAAGPMLAMARGAHPLYCDFFVGVVGNTLTEQFIVGCADFQRLYWMIDTPAEDLGRFDEETSFDASGIVCDTYTEVAKSTFKHDAVPSHGGSTAAVAFYMCLAHRREWREDGPTKGPYITGLLDATRKLNLEQAAMFALMHFFGGVYTTVRNIDVAGESYLTWHMNPDPASPSQEPLIIAVTEEVFNYARANLLK